MSVQNPDTTQPSKRRHRGILSALLLAAVFAMVALVLVPSLFGFQRYVITGGSMTGTIDKGSLVFDKAVPVSQLRVGDVITYTPPASSSHGRVTHRIVWAGKDEFGRASFQTKGDANAQRDPWKFTLTKPTQAKVSFHVPYVGYALAVLSIRWLRILLIGLPALLIALSLLASLWREAGVEARRLAEANGGSSSPRRALRRQRSAFLVVLGIGLAGVVASGAAFVSLSSNASGTFGAASDWVGPQVSSIARVGGSSTNSTAPQWTVTFNESVTGVDKTDFATVAGGGVTGASVSGVTGSGTTYTVTANAGSGEGTLGLNLVDDDSIKDTSGNVLGGAGTGNGNFTGEVFTIDRTAPTLSTLEMFDTDSNGKVDQVKATFSENLASSTSTTGWTLANVPGGGTLKSVSTSGAVATLTLNEGTANTAVGSFTVALSSSTGDIQDPAGNKAGFAAKAPTDKAAPVVVSLNRGSTDPSNASSVTWTAIFSEAVSGVGTGDFSRAVGTGLSGGSITGVTGSGTTYTVTVGTGTGSGTLGLNLVDDDSITDTPGNKLHGTGTTGAGDGSFTGQTYTIDKAAPSVVSINRHDSNPTNASSVQFDVTFNESVTGVDTTDFSRAVSGVSGSSISSVTGSGATYTVTVNTGTGSGTLGLNLVDDDSIKDTAGNVLGGAGTGNGNFTGQVYTVDKTPPTVSTINRVDATPTNGSSSVHWTVTFSESVTGVDATDFSLAQSGGVSGGSITGVTGSGTTYTVTVDPGTGSGTLGLNLVDDDTILDAATNKLGGTGLSNGNFTGQTYTIDRTAPTVTSINRTTGATNPTNGSTVQFDVTFSESVTGVDKTDFSPDQSGVSGASVTTVTGSGSSYTVTVSTGSGDGSLGLDLKDDDSIIDAAGNPLGGTGTGNGDFTTGQTFTIDRTAPSLTKLEMLDTNANGKVDQVKATFNETLASSTSTTPWTLTSAPGGATKLSLSTSGAVATLNLTEGTVDTSVGSFKVALAASSTGIRDAVGNQSSFAATAPQDAAAPIIVSLNRASSDPTNSSSVDWTATFSEAVTGVDTGDFAVAPAGGVTGASISNLTGSGSTYTVTVNTGSGEGTLGLNLVDDDTIQDTSANTNALGGTGTGNGSLTGQTYTIDRTAPTLSTLQMFDSNANGKVDQVKATFNENIQSSTATTGWTLTSAPGGATLKSVATSGAVATLTLNEGSVDTSVGSFTVALDATTGDIKDAAGNKAGFAATAPADKAGPVPTSLTDTNGTTDGKFQTGDTMTITFSEAVTGYPSTSNLVLTDGAGNDNNPDLLTVPGLFAAQTALGTAPGGTDYMSGQNGAVANFFGSTTATTLAQGATAKEIKLTLGTCNATSNCGNVATVSTAGAFTYTPSTSITDAAGNQAAGSLAVSAIKLF